MSIVFLVLAATGTLLTANALAPLPRRGHGPPWVPALFVGELAPRHAVLHLVLAAVCAPLGGWRGGVGIAALAVTGVSVLGTVVLQARALRARRVLERAAAGVLGEPVCLPRARWGPLLLPSVRVPSEVDLSTDLRYGPHAAHLMDRYLRRGAAGPAPAVLHVHGGGWTGGRRGRQARPLIHHLARQGWAVFDMTYRLSPKATFPDQLHDVRRALAWIRERAGELGVDPSFIALTGGSAGGQLAALAAMDPGGPPVQACVPLYGVHDLLRPDGRPLWPYLASHVLKVAPADDPAAWIAASPVCCAHDRRPPFLIVHGALDALVRPDQSERLAAALREAGGPGVGLAVLPGATHGFDSIPSLRSARLADTMLLVLEGLRRSDERRAMSPSDSVAAMSDE